MLLQEKKYAICDATVTEFGHKNFPLRDASGTPFGATPVVIRQCNTPVSTNDRCNYCASSTSRCMRSSMWRSRVVISHTAELRPNNSTANPMRAFVAPWIGAPHLPGTCTCTARHGQGPGLQRAQATCTYIAMCQAELSRARLCPKGHRGVMFKQRERQPGGRSGANANRPGPAGRIPPLIPPRAGRLNSESAAPGTQQCPG